MKDVSHGFVEVVFALAERQVVVTVEIERYATVRDVIRSSRLNEAFPDRDLSLQPVGIWGRLVALDDPVCSGDRVEIYRPLKVDPRERRRRKASSAG